MSEHSCLNSTSAGPVCVGSYALHPFSACRLRHLCYTCLHGKDNGQHTPSRSPPAMQCCCEEIHVIHVIFTAYAVTHSQPLQSAVGSWAVSSHSRALPLMLVLMLSLLLMLTL